MQCATHPDVETELRCGRCEKPICPRCMYQTPAGQRCRDCANLRKLPQYEVSVSYLVRGVIAAIVVGAIAGVIWGFIPGFLNLIFGLGVGYVVGEAVTTATNRKMGTQLQVIAAAGVVLAFVVRAALLASAVRNVDLGDVITRDIYGYLSLALGIVVAVGRFR